MLIFWVAALKILQNLWENLSNQFFFLFSRPLWPFSRASAFHVPFSEAPAVFYQLYCVRRWHQESLKRKICEMRLMFWVAALKILQNLWENLSNQFFFLFSRPLWPFSRASAFHVPFSKAPAVFYQLYCVRRWHQESLKRKICEIFNKIFSDFERSDQFLGS